MFEGLKHLRSQPHSDVSDGSHLNTTELSSNILDQDVSLVKGQFHPRPGCKFGKDSGFILDRDVSLVKGQFHPRPGCKSGKDSGFILDRDVSLVKGQFHPGCKSGKGSSFILDQLIGLTLPIDFTCSTRFGGCAQT